jgi:hypothetical protein
MCLIFRQFGRFSLGLVLTSPNHDNIIVGTENLNNYLAWVIVDNEDLADACSVRDVGRCHHYRQRSFPLASSSRSKSQSVTDQPTTYEDNDNLDDANQTSLTDACSANLVSKEGSNEGT